MYLCIFLFLLRIYHTQKKYLLSSDELQVEGLEARDLVVPKLGQGASAARVLDADPSKRRIQIVTAVHEPGASLDLVTDRQGGVRVLGPDAGGEAEIRVVHQVDRLLVRGNLHDTHHGSKGLFGHHAHLVGHVSEDLGGQVGRSFLIGGEEGDVDVGLGTLCN